MGFINRRCWRLYYFFVQNDTLFASVSNSRDRELKIIADIQHRDSYNLFGSKN